MRLFKIKDYNEPKYVKTVQGDGKKPSKSKIQKQSEDNIIKSGRNRFKLKKENKGTKERIIRNIKILFEQQEEDYYIPVRVDNFWNNYNGEHESSAHRNKNLSVKGYLNEIKPYLRGRIHSKSGNMEFMSYGNANEIVVELFELLLSRYQIALETSMSGSDFIFYIV